MPSASQGVLYVNGTQVTAARDLTVAESGQITFDPTAGYAGNAFFTYAAADASGTLGTTARYSLPVSKAACGATAGLDFSRRGAEDWKAFSATVGNTTVTTSGYSTTVTGTNTNTFAIGNNGTLPGPALVWQQNNIGNDPATTPNVATVTFTFSRPVSNLSFAVSDIDKDITNANFIDELTFDGYATTGSATPISLSAGDVAVAAGVNQLVAGTNTVQGIGVSASDPASTVVLTFPSPVQKLVLTYRNTAPYVNGTTNRTQTVGIPSLIFCSQAEVFTQFASGTTATTTGSNVNYTVDFGNNGADAANPQARTVTLPAGVTNVVVPTGATYTAATRVIDFGSATVASGTTNTFAFSFNAPATAGTYSLVASTSSPAEDPNLANNTATRTLVVSNCTTTASLDYTALTPGTAVTGIRRGAINGGATSQGPTTDAASDGITVKYQNYTSPSTTTQNDYYVGTSVALSSQALVWQITSTAVGDQSTVTMLLSRPVDNLSLKLLDIDKNLNTQNFTDRLTLDGYPTATGGTAATLTAANFTLGSSNSFIGNNTVEGTNNSASNETLGDLTVKFTSPVQRIVFTYTNTSTSTASSRQQTFGIPLLTYCSPADVATTITAASTPLFGGSQAQLNVTFVNNGPNAAASVTRQVQLIPNLVGVVATNGGTYDSASGLVTYTNTASLANGGNLNSTITFTTPVSGTVTASSVINTTTSEGGLTDNNTANASYVVTPAADLTTSLTGPTSVTPGQATGNYTVTFTNEGSSQATLVTQKVTLPTGATNVFVNGAPVTATGGVIDFGTATTLNSGAANTFTFSFTPAASATGPLALTSNVGTTGTVSQGNNAAPDAATLTLTTIDNVDVTAAITMSNTATVGTFTATFGNPGPQAAAGVVPTVQLPAGLTLSATPTGWSYTAATGLLTYNAAPATFAANTANALSVTINYPLNTAPSTPVTAIASVATTSNEAGRTANNVARAVMPNLFDLTTTLSGPASAFTGSPVTLLVTTTNNGPNLAPNATQMVTIPSAASLANNIFITNGGTYSYSGGVGTVTFPALANVPAGQTVTNSISFLAPSANFAPSATVSSTATELTTTNNGAFLNGAASSTSLTVSAGTGVALENETTTITTPSTVVTPGETVTYTVTSTNKGGAGATTSASVTQKVQLLPGLTAANLKVGTLTATGTTTLLFATTGGTTSYDPITGVLTYYSVTQAPGVTTTYPVIDLTVPAGIGNDGQLVATAIVSTDLRDNVPADNMASVGVRVQTTSDVTTSIVGPASTPAGLPVSYVVKFVNNGTTNASSVTETVQLPANLAGGVSILDAAGTPVSGATYNAATGLVTLPNQATLAAGAQQQYTLVLTAPAANFPVSSAVASTSPDGISSNNAATLATAVTANGDLAVSISGPPVAVVGNSVTYLVTTTNNGPTVVTNAVPKLQLPAGLTVLASGPGGAATVSTSGGIDTYTFATIGTLIPGGSVTSYLTFTMPNATGGQINALATVNSATTDLVASNNAAGLTTSINQASGGVADLRASVSLTTPTGSPASVPAGTQVTYTFGYRNASEAAGAGATAVNVVPTASLPAGLSATDLKVGGVTGSLSNNVISFNSGPASGATYNVTTGVLTFPTIASAPAVPSTSSTASYQATFAAPVGSGSLVVGAQVSSSTSDNLLTNNAAFTPLTINTVYDVTTTLAGPATAQPGTAASYTVTTLNAGPSTASTSTTQTVTGLPTNLGIADLKVDGLTGTLSGTTITYTSGATTVATYDTGTGTLTLAAVASLPAGTANAVVHSFSLAMPASGNVMLTANVSSAGETVNTLTNTATLTTAPANIAPVAQNVWNALRSPRGNTANTAYAKGLPITGLNATDANGAATIAAYTLVTVPNPSTEGSLYFGGTGTALVAGQPVTPAQAATLTFAPVAGYAGDVTFLYTTTDNGNGTPGNALTSPLAAYTIMVAQDQSSVYARPTVTKGGNANIYAAGDVLAYGIDPNTAVYNSAGIVYNTATGAPAAGTSNGLAVAKISPADSTTLAASGILFTRSTGLFTVLDPTKLPRNGASFGPFTVTSIDQNGGVNTNSVTLVTGVNPLPVELTAFTATAKNLDALLAWNTASEKNSDHFDVERSLNGTDFVKIDEVKGQGTSTSATDYARTDAGIGAKANGLVYYRLKQVDTDGTSSYSPVRSVRFGKVVPAIALFPNPATTATNLDLTALPAGSYQVSVLDAAGRTVLNTTLDAGLAHALDLNTIASGSYTLLVRGTNGGQVVNLTKRLIKE
ncbi:T9SS type A sorting domain-containing protein [Hymenobacter sp. DH14]|uniref:T9SS type A sorting domain-containing protein n=1 Tax=Hymenobacter cyanobacteriorum TaxID=2926463 RepID=A0A9X1VHA2_9BACT|nr:T9SS type A sorting domain-containing protein [Hymenobacter cyanobacteriorum]MCI1188653.1 T9SS type A sorting domain-containing protein [Hymenobacter cyanobacteriorum]